MISYICIVVSLFIPIACAAYAKFSTKGYDNAKPREFLEGLKGRGKRANYAQNNCYETFPAFAVGVVVAHQLDATIAMINMLAVTYVVARILYAVSYIMDNHNLRSLAWAIAFGSTLGLYFSGF